MISSAALRNNIAAQRKGEHHMPDSLAAIDPAASTHTATSTSTVKPMTAAAAAAAAANTCNNKMTTNDELAPGAPHCSGDALCAKTKLPIAPDTSILRYSPYPPFAPLPPPSSAATSATFELSSSSSHPSSSANSSLVTDKTPRPYSTSTYCQDIVSSCLGTSTTNTGKYSTMTSSVGHTATMMTTSTTLSKTITPMAGAGNKTYVINDLGRLTCTPGITKAKKITPTIVGTPERSVSTSSDSNDDALLADEDEEENASVSSLDISDHTQTVADALNGAGIVTTIVVGSTRPKCLFTDGTTTATDCRDADDVAKPPSGCRGLLAKFNEVEVDAEGSMPGCSGPSSPASHCRSSASSRCSTSSGNCCGSGSEEEYAHDDCTDIVPCDDEGLNLGDEMNLERKADTIKWKKRVGKKKGKSKKKKRRRLA